MERKEFEALAREAFDRLPEVFKEKLENVDLTIEEEPDIVLLERSEYIFVVHSRRSPLFRRF